MFEDVCLNLESGEAIRRPTGNGYALIISLLASTYYVVIHGKERIIKSSSLCSFSLFLDILCLIL